MKKNNEFIQYANSFQTVINLGLERILKLLDCVGNPQKQLKVIHIAGTNGKGSVCSFLQSIMSLDGKKTGKYISPNLVRVNERISVDGVEISDEDLNRLLLKIETFLPDVKEATGEIPSQFEIWTAVACCYFLEQGCDIVILETGLGGRFDATNVVEKPLACVICRIALDHVSLLGDTISQIAFEKAGIIKSGVPVITLLQDKEALSVLENCANDKNAPLYITEPPKIFEPKEQFEVFSYRHLSEILCGISGYHQIENACLAIETAMHFGVSDDIILEGIAKARHIGRLVWVTDRILFDGAHNFNGMSALHKSLERYYPGVSKIFVSAFMKDKEIKDSLSLFAGETFYFTSVKENERSEKPDALVEIGTNAGVLGTSFPSIEEALLEADKTKKMIVVCGSLYLYKDLWDFLKDKQKEF